MSEHITYDQYRAMLQSQVAGSLEKIKEIKRSTSVVGTLEDAWKARLNKCLRSVLNTDDANKNLVHPPKSASLQWAPDYALSMFSYAKDMGLNPMHLAKNAAERITPLTVFSRVEATGPYMNLRLSDDILINKVTEILRKGKDYGTLTDKVGKAAIVEYSSPNVAKPFGINHLRSTVIGESLARFLLAVGYTVVRDNHLGDWGTQFGNLLAACDEYAPDCEFTSFSMDDLTTMYVRFSQEKKESPRLVRLGREYFARLEAGDTKLLDRWAVAFNLSLKEFSAMYDRLNVRFDTMLGEGYFVHDSIILVDELRNMVSSELVVYDKETPAVYINAEHVVMIRTQDGYCVYAARDLATVRFREQTYSPDISLYVVGDEQSSYFRSLFRVAEAAELNTNTDGSSMQLEHVNFGLLLDESGKKLSTRKGTSGKLEDVLDQLNERTAQEILSRNPDMDEKQLYEIANKVAVGALIWNDLQTDRTSNVRFDINHMLELGGGTVIDVLYAYTRTCSILNKLDSSVEKLLLADLPKEFSTETEHKIALMMSEYGDMVRKTAEARAPHLFVMYLQELVQLHGRFYEESRVTGLDNPKLASLRISLHYAYKIVMENGLGLLNIPVVERL